MKLQISKILLSGMLIAVLINLSAPFALAEDPKNPAPQGSQQSCPDGKCASESFSIGKYLTVGEKKDAKNTEGVQEQKYLQSKFPVASFILQVINFLTLSIGSLSFLTMVVGGFTLLISHGSENLTTKGKDMIKYAVIGLVVAFSAYFVTAFVQSIFYEVA